MQQMVKEAMAASHHRKSCMLSLLIMTVQLIGADLHRPKKQDFMKSYIELTLGWELCYTLLHQNKNSPRTSEKKT